MRWGFQEARPARRYPVILILLYNVGDFTGKMTPVIVPATSVSAPVPIFACAVARLAFVPAYFFAARAGVAPAMMVLTALLARPQAAAVPRRKCDACDTACLCCSARGDCWSVVSLQLLHRRGLREHADKAQGPAVCGPLCWHGGESDIASAFTNQEAWCSGESHWRRTHELNEPLGQNAELSQSFHAVPCRASAMGW